MTQIKTTLEELKAACDVADAAWFAARDAADDADAAYWAAWADDAAARAELNKPKETK